VPARRGLVCGAHADTVRIRHRAHKGVPAAGRPARLRAAISVLAPWPGGGQGATVRR
jgi:hypothetical protein